MAGSLKDRHQPAMGPGQGPPTLRRHDKGILDANEADSRYSLLWLDRKHHPFLQRFIEPFRDHRALVNPQTDPMAEELHRVLPVSHEPVPELRGKAVHDRGVDLRWDRARFQERRYLVLHRDALLVDPDRLFRDGSPEHVRLRLVSMVPFNTATDIDHDKIAFFEFSLPAPGHGDCGIQA